VLDIAFLNKSEFACSTSVVSHDSAGRTIMVWDFNSGAIMSNQIFLERYTCPSLKLNSSDCSFIAQTNGDYIVSFSSHRPYKMKNKRYMGHKVSGFGIECDISPDGQYIASGDTKGDVYFYNYADATVVNKMTVKPDVATNRLKWHPILSSTLAVATYDGQIHVWKVFLVVVGQHSKEANMQSGSMVREGHKDKPGLSDRIETLEGHGALERENPGGSD
ncbi:WD repeat-containing protein 25, partial [Araneus ventricosus]